jgi:hypothetical protein
MNAEISFFGVYLPSLLVCAPIAYALLSLIKLMIGALGLQRFIWHRSLFNAAIFICLLGVTLSIISERLP